MVRHQAAQAQAHKQEQITATESLSVVRSLLRVSIFHVAYLRGLFHEKNFKDISLESLENMNVKMLLPSTADSKKLVDWVEQDKDLVSIQNDLVLPLNCRFRAFISQMEQTPSDGYLCFDAGVYDALKQNFLKTLIFGISTDHNGLSLLEEYKFSFSYGDEGKVTMDMTLPPTKGKNKKKGVASYESVKQQVIRLMRLLVSICNTLDIVPDERYLFMKMLYHDSAPDDYEPPCFKPVEGDLAGHFPRKPFSMGVGSVDTNHHMVALKVLSTLDNTLDDGDETMSDMGLDQEKSLHQGSTLVSRCNQSPSEQGNQETQDDDMQCGEGAGATTSQEDKYDEVKAYCMKRKQVDVMDIMGAFVDVRQKTLDSHILPRLLKEGVLTALGDPDKYQVVRSVSTGAKERPPAPRGSKATADAAEMDAAMEAAAAEAAAQHLGDLSVKPGDTYAATQALPEEEKEVPPVVLTRKRSAVDSLNAQMPGSTRDEPTSKTTSGAATEASARPRRGRLAAQSACPSTAIAPDLSQQQEEAFFESQLSQDRKRRKASMVYCSIHQFKKRTRTAGSSRA